MDQAKQLDEDLYVMSAFLAFAAYEDTIHGGVLAADAFEAFCRQFKLSQKEILKQKGLAD